MLVPGGRHGRTGPGFATPPKRPVLTLPIEGQPRRMIRQTSGAIVASPVPGGEEKALIVALTAKVNGRDQIVAALAPGVHPSGAIRTQRWRTAVRSRVSTSFVQAGPRARGRAAGYGGVDQPPTEPRASRERSVFDRAQEGGGNGALVVRRASENARWRHSSFSFLWYDLWYDFSKLLFLLRYWRRGSPSPAPFVRHLSAP